MPPLTNVLAAVKVQLILDFASGFLGLLIRLGAWEGGQVMSAVARSGDTRSGG